MSSPAPAIRRRRLGQRGISLVEVSVVVTITGILATLATYSVRERIFESHSVEAVAMLGSIRSGLLVKSEDLSGNSAATLQIGGRVGGFGGPMGLPGVLGKPKDKDGGIDGDGNNGHGNNPDHCDPDNPGNGGGDCGGSTSSSSSGSSGSSSSSSSGSGSSSSGSSGGGSSSSSSSSSQVDGNNALCTSAAPVPSSLDSVAGRMYRSRPDEWKAGSRDGGWKCLSISMNGAQRFQYGYDVGATAVPTGAAPAGADSTFAAWARGDLDADGRTSWFVLNGAVFDGQVVMAPALSIIDQGE